MPDNLTTASGVASGISAFTQAFNQARLQKFQMKQMENAPLTEILMEQVKDPNTNYYQRAKIIDQIQKLHDPKAKIPLTHILGYDKLNEQDFTVEDAQKGTPAQPGKTLTSDQTNTPFAGQTLQLQGQQATNDVPAVTKKYGDTTPAEVHLRLQQKLEDAKDAGDIDKQAKLLKINYTLQSEILNKGGFTHEVSRGFGVDGNYQIIMSNGDTTKTIDLGKFSPEAIEKAKLLGANKANSGKFGQLAHANYIVNAYENDPTSVNPAEYTAAKQILGDFEKTGELKDSTIAANLQKTGGTQPIQPGAAADNARADENIRIARQTSYDNAVAESNKTSSEAADYSAQVTQHWNSVIEPIKDEINALIKDKGEDPNKPSVETQNSPEFRSLQNKLLRETTNYNALKSKADSAVARDAAARQRVIDAKNRLNSSSSSSNNTKGSSTKYSTTQQAMIANIRKANGTAATNLTDDQIAEQILASPFKAKFK